MENDDFRVVEDKIERNWRGEVEDVNEDAVTSVWEHRIIPQLRMLAKQRGTSSEQYHNTLSEARALLTNICYAICLESENNDPPRRTALWQHQKLELFRPRGKTHFSVDRVDLARIAAAYLAHPDIQTNYVDWVLLDALIFAELDAFNVAYMANKSGGSMAWLLASNWFEYAWGRIFEVVINITLNYVAPLALIGFLLFKEYFWMALIISAIWIMYVLILVFTYPRRWRMRRKWRKLLQSLKDLYIAVDGETISPRRLKETLDQAAAEGVVLDGAVFGIVDRMIARDPAVFVRNYMG